MTPFYQNTLLLLCFIRFVSEETYKGRKIVIKNKNQLTIDEESISTLIDASGKYSCTKLPYSDFSSLLDLGKAVVDSQPT